MLLRISDRILTHVVFGEESEERDRERERARHLDTLRNVCYIYATRSSMRGVREREREVVKCCSSWFDFINTKMLLNVISVRWHALASLSLSLALEALLVLRCDTNFAGSLVFRSAAKSRDQSAARLRASFCCFFSCSLPDACSVKGFLLRHTFSRRNRSKVSIHAYTYMLGCFVRPFATFYKDKKKLFFNCTPGASKQAKKICCCAPRSAAESSIIKCN